jgi:alkylation response protein AidB-like acyl-CoA dehydrogenase
MLTQDQLSIRSLARDFAAREIRPHAEEWERQGAIPREVVGQLAEMGFLGMLVPEEYDGLGLDETSYLVALEQIAWGDASVAVAMSVHNSLPTRMLLSHGTPEQKERWLKPMARGEILGAFALSEADAGSDAASITSQARRGDGGWILNGAKAWVTNGGLADVAIVMCRSDEGSDRKGTAGIAAFIVPTDTPGYVVGKKEDKMGQRASETVSVALDNLFLPDEHLLGDPSRGLFIALEGLAHGRMGIAAVALGIAQAALDHAVAYADERVQFGQPIREFEGIRFKLADMATRVEASRALLLAASEAVTPAGSPVLRLSSMAKLFASETATFVTTQAVQVFGGYGYMKEYPVERLFRDAKVTEIYEGTSEIQRLVIARELYR